VRRGSRRREEEIGSFVFGRANAEADGWPAGFGNDTGMAFASSPTQSSVGGQLREQEAEEAKEN